MPADEKKKYYCQFVESIEREYIIALKDHDISPEEYCKEVRLRSEQHRVMITKQFKRFKELYENHCAIEQIKPITESVIETLEKYCQ